MEWRFTSTPAISPWGTSASTTPMGTCSSCLSKEIFTSSLSLGSSMSSPMRLWSYRCVSGDLDHTCILHCPYFLLHAARAEVYGQCFSAITRLHLGGLQYSLSAAQPWTHRSVPGKPAGWWCPAVGGSVQGLSHQMHGTQRNSESLNCAVVPPGYCNGFSSLIHTISLLGVANTSCPPVRGQWTGEPSGLPESCSLV